MCVRIGWGLGSCSASVMFLRVQSFFLPMRSYEICAVCRYDISKQGLTKEQCREALDVLGLPKVEVPSTAPVDLKAFRAMVPSAL